MVTDIALRLLIVAAGSFALPWVTFRLLREVGHA